MKTQQIVLTISVVAATAIPRMRWVNFAGQVAQRGDAIMGVAATDTDAGEVCPVNTHGVLLVVAAAPIYRGQSVGCGDDGMAVAAQGGDAFGYALDDVPAGGVLRVLRENHFAIPPYNNTNP